MAYRIVFSPRSEAQLDRIHAYIAGVSGDGRADDVVAHLIDACRSLEVFPRRGTRRDDLYRGLRVMGHRRLASIAFTVGSDVVTIQGIYWRGRDIGAGLFSGR